VKITSITNCKLAPGGVIEGYVFNGCTNLQAVEFGTSTVTSLTTINEFAFYDCDSLEKIDFGPSVDISVALDSASIDNNAFNDDLNNGVIWGKSANVGRNFLTAVHNKHSS
jgi:hypothetical protein